MKKIYHSKLEWLRAKLDKWMDSFEPYFTDLFKKYHPPLTDWFIQLRHPIEDANDLANITLDEFIQCQKEGKYQEKAKKWSYLKRIAHFKHLHLTRIKNSQTELFDRHPSEEYDEAALLEKEQLLNSMLDCVGQAKQRNLETTDLFVLYYQNKTLYTISELAAQEGVSEGGLKRRFHRMRDSLKNCLENKQKRPHDSTV
jgi:DNA-directed RNA polymerase specialized sigma24 family protein